jgi:hypothetical protein
MPLLNAESAVRIDLPQEPVRAGEMLLVVATQEVDRSTRRTIARVRVVVFVSVGVAANSVMAFSLLLQFMLVVVRGCSAARTRSRRGFELGSAR